MTDPGSATGMSYGDDYVAARLSIEVPQDGAEGLRSITAEVERFRTAMEAATRADMSQYLDQMAEAAKRASDAQVTLNQNLQTYLSLSGTRPGAAGTGSSGVPMGPMIHPFTGGSGHGMGESPGIRPPNPSDVVYQLNSAAGRSPTEAAQYLNMQHQRGGVPNTVSIDPQSIQALANQLAERERVIAKQAKASSHERSQVPTAPHRPTAPDDTYGKFDKRIGQAAGLAGQVMNEIGQHGVIGGVGDMAKQGLDWARKRVEERAKSTQAPDGTTPAGGKGGQGGGGADDTTEDDNDKGGLKGIAKGLGIASGAVGVGLAALGVVEKGGAMVQGWRNIASSRGGGAGEGFQLEMKQRLLSLDPTINTEQSRQIYQAMLSEGYAGANGGDNHLSPNSAESIKNFMATNIKQFNMDVSESVQLLRLSAKGTTLSLGQLSKGLYQIQQQSKNSWQSQQDIQREVISEADSLVSQGVDPAQAWTSSQRDSQMFAKDPLLAGSMTTPVGPSMEAQMRLHGGPGGTALPVIPGLRPDLYAAWEEDEGRGPESKMNVLEYHAKFWQRSAQATSRDPKIQRKNAVRGFKIAVRDFWKGHPAGESDEVAGRLYDQLISKGAKGVIEEERKATIIKRAGQEDGDMVIHEQRHGFMGTGTSTYTSKVEDQIIEAYGGDPSQVEVVSEDGSVTALDTTNLEQQKKLLKGDLNWRHKGDTGKGISLAETPQEGITSEFSTDDPSNPAGKKQSDKDASKRELFGTLHIKVDGFGRIQSIPNQIPLTANQAAANAGQGTAQVNNPPMGDGWRTRWGY